MRESNKKKNGEQETQKLEKLLLKDSFVIYIILNHLVFVIGKESNLAVINKK